ncbi:MAG: hypothetical protein NXH73_07020 [Flavobacteriaceae bacterium]|nr:hypothetical protein [Flavobacteriaceae bacterium]
MKVILVLLLFFHGAIHILGFLKGFQLAKISALSETISKPMGVLWGITTSLFLLTLIGLLLKKEFWPILAFLALLLSQTLLIIHWQDAKFGSIANLLILLFTLPYFGKQLFDKQILAEKNPLVNSLQQTNQDTLSAEEIIHLPPAVQNWLFQSGAVNSPKAIGVRLSQSGSLKTKPDSKWLYFQANQYFNVRVPAFLWVTEVELFPGVILSGRDRLEEGTGEMLIKLASLIPVVNEKDNSPINTGAMIRFLGEICWFPSAAVNEYIKWEEIDSLSAKATFTGKSQSVSGIFHFTEAGEISSFEALRYFGGGKDAQRHLWKIEVLGYKTFEGIKVPALCRVIWKLPEGDFEWLQLEITHLKYQN